VLSAAQFSAIFAARRVLRGKLFALHYRPNGLPGPRLGLVIPKKQARAAVLRNAIKRQAREIFRQRRHMLPAADLALRLTAPVATRDSAARAAWRAEIAALLDRLAGSSFQPAR
jgi:ribonuclease P protein component